MRTDEQNFIVLGDALDIDVLDENLYCYENAVFTLTSSIQKRASDNLLRKVERFIDSVPAMQKAADNVKSKTEYIPRLDLLSDEIKRLMQEGSVQLIPCKDNSDAYYLHLRSIVKDLIVNGKKYGKNIKIKDIPLSTKTVPADIVGAMQCLSMQSQLAQITARLIEISEVCEYNFGRIIQGQRDDRIAKLLSSRSCFIQALALSDENLQHQMLIQAICDANSARAELAYQIKSDIVLLGCDKIPKVNDMERIVCDINAAMVAMNNAVHISLYSYQALGEHTAQLSVIKEHETFIKQVLLKEIEYKKNKHIAWNLICSSGNSETVPQEFYSIPTKLIESCVAFIEDNKENNFLEDKSNE